MGARISLRYVAYRPIKYTNQWRRTLNLKSPTKRKSRLLPHYFPLKLGTQYPCPWPVDTDVIFDGTWTRPVDTGSVPSFSGTVGDDCWHGYLSAARWK